MKLKENHIPLYLKLYWKLKDDILFMELSPGERMPTVEEFHKLHGVSQGTVHKALELLEKDGLISKKRGSGVFVLKDMKVQPIDQMLTGDTYIANIRSFDLQILSEEWVEATNRIRSFFYNRPDAFRNNQIWRFEFLFIHKIEKRRKTYGVAFIPAWITDQVAIEDIKVSAEEGLIQMNGFRTERMTVETRPWICNAEISERIGMLEGSAVFRRLYTYYSEDNQILAYFDIIPAISATIRDICLKW